MKRPWNITQSSVYCLLTLDERPNYNICTYVSAVSMKPKIYAIAIDYASQTFKNLKRKEPVVLQILSNDQKHLIKPLGKRSGKSFDKSQYLRKHEELMDWEGLSVLKKSAGLLRMTPLKSIDFDGDHALFLFRVEKSRTLNETSVLDFQTLIKEKIIL